MRIIAAVPLLLLATACEVENDTNQTSVTIDRGGSDNAARDNGADLEQVGEAVGNEARNGDAEVTHNNVRPLVRRDFKGKARVGG